MVPPHLLAPGAIINDGGKNSPSRPGSSSSSSSEEDGLPTSVQKNWGALGAIDFMHGADHQQVECSICTQQMVRPAIGGGCAHHACEPCYKQWYERKPSCPVCRAPVWRISVDFEFAKLVGCDLGASSNLTTSASSAASSASLWQDNTPESGESSDDTDGVLRVQVEGPAGITLSSEGGVVTIVKLRKGNGGDRAGLKVRDRVQAVNGTPVHDHSTACSFIERRCTVGDCELTIQRPQPLGRGLLRKFVRTLTP